MSGLEIRRSDTNNTDCICRGCNLLVCGSWCWVNAFQWEHMAEPLFYLGFENLLKMARSEPGCHDLFSIIQILIFIV